MSSAVDHGVVNVPANSKLRSTELNRAFTMLRADRGALYTQILGAKAAVLAGLAVSATGTGLQVQVATGNGLDGNGAAVYVPPTVPDTAVPFGLPAEGTEPKATLAAAHATLDRIDLVYLRANTLLTDYAQVLTSDGDTATLSVVPQTSRDYFTLGVVTGTPNAVPVAPAALLSTDLVLAQVRVPAAAVTLTSANITDRRTLAPTIVPLSSLSCAAAGGLTLAYLGAVLSVANTPTVVPSSTLTMTDNATNYVYVNASGVVTKGAAWPVSGIYWPMAVVTTLAGAITSVVDRRGWVASNPIQPPVQAYQRQSILQALRDGSGVPAFLAAVGGSLAVTLLATTIPVMLAFASGNSAAGTPADPAPVAISADVASAWAGLTANATNHLYVDRNAGTGALTYGASLIAPIVGMAAPTTLPTGIVAYYPMNEAAGSAIADYFGAINATATGTSIVAGKFGNARGNLVGGNGSYVTANGLISATAGTVAGWIYINSTAGANPATLASSRASTTTTQSSFVVSTTALTLSDFNGTNSVATVALTTGTWYHVAFTWSPMGRAIYLNGVPQTITNPNAGSLGAAFDAVNYIGNTQFQITSNTSSYTFQLDDLAFWSRPLAPADVSALYNMGVALSATGNYPTDLHWYDPARGVMQRWTGAAWQELQRLFVGQAVTGASSVSTVTPDPIGSMAIGGIIRSPGNSSVWAYQSTGQSVTGGVVTKVSFQTVLKDHLGEFSTAQNRFTAQTAGEYLVDAAVHFGTQSSGSTVNLQVYVNGLFYGWVGSQSLAANTSGSVAGTCAVDLNTGDYVEMYMSQPGTATNIAGRYDTFVRITRIPS